MGWNGTTKRMSYPVSMGDIRDAAGYNSLVLKDLVANGAWNKWAKYKFVRQPYIGFKTQLASDHTWKSSADWWKGDDGRCGLSFQTFADLGDPATSSSFLYKLRTGALEWTYNRPRGQSRNPKEWYRMWDLIQYYGDAPKPVEGVPSSIMLTSAGQLVLDPFTNRGDATSLQLSDFTINNVSVEDFYLGFFVYYSSSQYAVKTSGRISDGDLTCTFTNMTAYAGRDVTIVPFLSDRAITQGGALSSGTYLCVDVLPQTVHVNAYSSGLQTAVEAQWRESLHVRVHYNVRLTNNTAAAITVTNIVIALYRSGSQSAMDSATVASQSVPANDLVDLPGTLVLGEAYDPDQDYTVVVTSTGNVASGDCIVDEYRN